MKKQNIKKLIIFILIPLVVGFIGNLLGGDTDIYTKIATPSFAPPGFLFPIVWSILYILMGISSYLIYKEKNSKDALTIYFIQLGVNALWSLFFFRLNWFLFSSLWLVLLLCLIIYMIYLFSKLNKTAAYIQIPYALWVTFALVLNSSIYILNS